MSQKKIVVVQVKSANGQTDRNRGTLAALGLGRIGKSCEHVMTPSTQGMLKRIQHLVSVREATK